MMATMVVVKGKSDAEREDKEVLGLFTIILILCFPQHTPRPVLANDMNMSAFVNLKCDFVLPLGNRIFHTITSLLFSAPIGSSASKSY